MRLVIKDRLDKANITRYELAKRLGLNYKTVDNMYKGKTTRISLDVLGGLCRELDCAPSDILIADKK